MEIDVNVTAYTWTPGQLEVGISTAGGDIRDARLVMQEGEQGSVVFGKPRLENDWAVLIRIGDPEHEWTVIEGSVTAVADADRLILLRPGALVRVMSASEPSHEGWAVWLEEDVPLTLLWSRYVLRRAVAEVAAGQAPARLTGLVECWTYVNGALKRGIDVGVTSAGSGLMLGNRHARQALVPLLRGVPVRLERAAVARLATPAGWANAGLDVAAVPALLLSGTPEPGVFVLRVITRTTFRSAGIVETWAGDAERVADGHATEAGHDAAATWQDALFVMRDGAVLHVPRQGWAIIARNGRPELEQWRSYKTRDVRERPEFWKRKGFAAPGSIPPDWIGRVPYIAVAGQKHTLVELISIEPLVVDFGWDKPKPRIVTLHPDHVDWLRLRHADLVPLRRRPLDEQFNRFADLCEPDPAQLLDLTADEPALGPIIEEVYGRDPESGEEQHAYGTLAFADDGLHLWWFGSRDAALTAQAHVIADGDARAELARAWHAAKREQQM